LRLDDDKADSSGPATGQVELDIRGGEVAQPDRTAKERVLPAIGKSSERLESTPTFYVNRRDFKLPMRIEPTRREGIRSVRLYVSRDGGRTFQRWQDTRWREEQPGVKDSISFRALDDGVYHCVIQTEDGQGRLEPSDIMKVRPDLTLCVDTTPPVVQIQKVRPVNGSTEIRWSVSDINLDLPSLRLEYRYLDEKVWTEALIKPATEGSYRWDHLRGGAELVVRLRVRDKAGNEGFAVGEIVTRRPE
jgi:hypothetical protein